MLIGRLRNRTSRSGPWQRAVVLAIVAAMATLSQACQPDFGPSIRIVNDTSVPVVIALASEGQEVNQRSVSGDETIEPGQTQSYGLDLMAPGNTKHCTKGVILARQADRSVVAFIPPPVCGPQSIFLSRWPPPPS